ncbi:hypothetical protein GCM10027408_30500 [Microbacterium tumbae]
MELRLAARQARRAWPTSLLVIVLVALPMVLVSGAATFLASRMPAPEQTITAELGGTAAWFMIVGGEDPTRGQAPDDPYWYDVERDEDGAPVHPELTPPDDLDGLVPDRELLEVSRGEVMARTPDGAGRLSAVVGDAADPRLDGRYELLDGRRPQKDSEAALSPGALARLDARVGDSVTLIDPAATLTIVGVMKEAVRRDDEQTVFLSSSAVPDDVASTGSEQLWFAPDWQPSADDLPALNRAGVIAYARDLVAASGAPSYTDPATAWSIAGVAAIVGGFTAYLVILLAGAGFAVSARRQQRSLAVAASVGADRGSVFRVVLLQGTVLGLIGGVLGAAVGTAIAYPALVLLDDGAVSSFWGFHTPWWAIVGIVLFATAVGTASALVPARAATRGDVLASLRGTRTPPRVRTDRPFWGTLIGLVGIGATVAGGLGLAALNAADTIDYGDPLRNVCLAGIVAGPLLFQIGAIVAGHWLLSLIARGASRLGLAPRIAARDAAANPARIVPAFAAIAACVFIASFTMTTMGVFTAQTARSWWYQAPLGSVVVTIWGEDDPETVRMATDALEQTEPDAIGFVRQEVGYYTADSDAPSERVTAEIMDYVDCDDIDQGPCMDRATALFGNGSPYVVAPEDLDIVLGVRIGDAQHEAFARGGAVVLDPSYLEDGAILLHRWDRAEADSFYEDWWPSKAPPEPLDTLRVPAEVVTPPQRLPWGVVLSPEAADRFGYETVVGSAIGSYSVPPSSQALDRLALAAGQPWDASSGFTYYPENGPPSVESWLWLVLAAAAALVLGAGGVALGLARVERRPDDATLAAVGASGGIRRRIALWQAIVIVGIGSVTGTVAGIIPVWGIVMQSRTGDGWELRMSDTPWPWLAILAVGLPLIIAVVSWLVPSRRPDLTRRTVIA